MQTNGRPFSLRISVALVAVFGLLGIRAIAQDAPIVPAETLLSRATLTAFDEELSGTSAKDHVIRLTQLHRVPASPGFHDAIEYVMGRAKAFGLRDVHVETFPGDGNTYFGTLHGNRGWRVEGGSLDEVSPRPRRITSFDDLRIAVADNSESADVTAELVDAGSGATPRDYEGKDVRGKLVLCDSTPGVCHKLAVEEHGAVGLVSYNSNQVSGWWRDDEDLVRWGHLDARGRKNTFALMISVREARSLQQRLSRGEHISLQAIVKARNDDSLPYETLIATIPGTNQSAGDIVFSCHLDHQKPGANDYASGCAANLEIARTLQTLVTTKRIQPPVRTIRFIWPSEMTGTIAYLTKYPEIAGQIKAAVHLDMVGGDPFITKSILHVTRSPWSIATVTDDVEEVFGRYVIDASVLGAAEGGGAAARAVRAAGGSKDALWADITPYESGSDHWIYQEGGFRIPSVYLRDHPDIFIHTSKDLPDNIEPTKMKRSAFIAMASGYYLATMPDHGESLMRLSFANAYERLAEDGRRAVAMAANSQMSTEAANIVQQALLREQRRLRSLTGFVSMGSNAGNSGNLERGGPAVQPLQAMSDRLAEIAKGMLAVLPAPGTMRQPAARAVATDRRVPMRNAAVKGPLSPTGEWVIEHAGTNASQIALAHAPSSDDLTYEIVNFVDGQRTVTEIRDAVSAEYVPVDVKAVAEYLDILVKAKAITFK
jgi:aminopeptidase YwaD